ncbi:MAG: TlpA family protein disulfide reductase [Flavobacteriales bacterium]|nr:TlpA family protein disulfide reductase [Flavobacteriales bacterium]
MVLLEIRGMDSRPVDSILVDRKGKFSFAGRSYPAGFYQLQVNDTDRVDIILDPRERNVVFKFTGAPLQQHVEVVASAENKALWAYKGISRAAQFELAGLREQRNRTSLEDLQALARLDSLTAAVEVRRRSSLDAVLLDRPESTFAHIIKADRKLTGALPLGPQAIGAAFAWSDGRMLRSSLYPKALMSYLQSIPFDAPGGLHAGVDSLMHWASGDEACWTYARSFLLRTFDQFGADDLAQYMVDRYAMGPGALRPLENGISALVSERLRVAIGARAPEVLLPDPVAQDTTRLSVHWQRNERTVLFFYSSTCDHCHAQIPGLRAMQMDLKGRGLGIVGISVDTDLDEFMQALTEHGISWPSYSELNGWGSSAAKAFHVKATPTLIVLDNMGTIMARPHDHVALREFLVGRTR